MFGNSKKITHLELELAKIRDELENEKRKTQALESENFALKGELNSKIHSASDDIHKELLHNLMSSCTEKLKTIQQRYQLRFKESTK